MAKLKLLDIAKALGLSKTTVSKAINNYSDVNQFTRIKVLNYVKRVGFEPNRQASSLRKNEIKTVAVIFPELNHDFFNRIQEGILSVSQKNEYNLCVAISHESFETEKKLVYQFLKRNVDAIFLSLCNDTKNFDHLEEIHKQTKILVMFDKIEKTINCPKIIIDDRKASFLATEHLIKNGCKKILHFRGGFQPQISIDRYLGYRDALNKYGISFEKEMVFVCETADENAGFLAAKKVIESKIKFDGLFAFTDYTAIGAIQFFKSKKIRIPKDVLIVGFSNWKVTRFTSPTISTVDQSAFLMGENIFNAFLEEKLLKSQGDPPSNKIFKIPAKLIIRESSEMQSNQVQFIQK